MEVTFEEKVVTKKVVTIEFSEEEALILRKIVGNIGGNHEWRKVTSGIYNGINDALGYHKCDTFSEKHNSAIERSMMLKDKEG